MAKKKDFEQGGPVPPPINAFYGRSDTPSSARLAIKLPTGSVIKVDYSEYLGLGFDDTVFAVSDVVRDMVATGTPTPRTLESMVASGLKYWWRFSLHLVSIGRIPSLDNIDRDMMSGYADWLSMQITPKGEQWSSNTARAAFAKTKTALEGLVKRGLLSDKNLFARNLFPGATSLHNRRVFIRPLSDQERDKILRPLSKEVAQIFDGTHDAPLWKQLGLCAFAIFLKAGLNATPLLEMPRDLNKCFFDHPRMNRRILVTFKRRAGKHTITSLQSAGASVVTLDVYRICQHVLKLTNDVARLAAGTPQENLLWLYQHSDGKVIGLSPAELSLVANGFTKKYNLVRDDGSKLKMTSRLFRNTKINRVWRASQGNLLATSKTAANLPEVTERYLAVTPDMLDDHRLAGKVLVATLLDGVKRDATPHSGCSDPLNGEFAPKNGEYCMDFLSCFRCKSQVIIQEDLYKLYSFYWALFRQRSRISAENWKKLFAWVIRVIDRDIAPKFPADIVALEKERARKDPHPMWLGESAQAALRSIV